MSAFRNAWHILREDYHKFEVDPAYQLKYHRRMVIFWLWNFPAMNVIVGIDIWATLTNHIWIGLLLTAILLAVNTNYSLYANFDTETGDAHAAYAGVKAMEIQQSQTSQTSTNKTSSSAQNDTLPDFEQKTYSRPLSEADALDFDV